MVRIHPLSNAVSSENARRREADRPERALGFFRVQFTMLPAVYNRIAIYRRLSVSQRRIDTQIRPRDTLFIHLTPDLSTLRERVLDDATLDIQFRQALRDVRLPESVPLFISANMIGRRGEPLGQIAQQRLRFQSIDEVSIASLFDALADEGYDRFNWYHAQFTVEMYLRPILTSLYRGGCMKNASYIRYYEQYVTKAPKNRYLYEYDMWSPGQKASFGKCLKNNIPKHIQHLRGIYVYNVTSAFVRPVCGIMALLYGIEMLKVRRSEVSSNQSIIRRWERDSELWYQAAVSIADLHTFQDTISIDELVSIQRVLYPNAHIRFYDRSQGIIHATYRSFDTSYALPPEDGYEQNELTPQYIDKLNNDTIHVFYDYEQRHFLPIYSVGYFMLKFAVVDRLVHNPEHLQDPPTLLENVLKRKRVQSKHNLGKLLQMTVHDGVGIADFQLTSQSRVAPCPSCWKLIRHDDINIRRHFCHTFQCRICCRSFKTKISFHKHISTTSSIRCNNCGTACHGMPCYRSHLIKCTGITYVSCQYCKASLPSNQLRHHKCNEYLCRRCNTMVRDTYQNAVDYHYNGYIQLHKCPFQRRQSISDDNNAYFAFDFESMLYNDPSLVYPFFDTSDKVPAMNENVSSVYVHIVNCASYRSIDIQSDNAERDNITQSGTVFTLQDFWNAVCSLSTAKRNIWIAHNMQAYDGRLLFDFLQTKDIVPVRMIWVGGKIMEMEYTHPTLPASIIFRDSLNHLAASLSKLPSMFGLPTSIIKKGFFPYLFNTAENQNYVGTIPDKQYFNYMKLSAKVRNDFDEWYSEYRNREYDFKQEMISYCENDVLILSLALQAYIRICIQYGKQSPLRDLTIAQYTYNTYMRQDIPTNLIYRLDEYYATFARRALRGGNTNVRQMYYQCDVNDAHYSKGESGLRYIDIQSLYPTVQFYDDLPCGYPSTHIYDEHSQPDETFLSSFFGFIECDMWVHEYHEHPILPVFLENRLFMTHHPTSRIVLTSIEFQTAMNSGYYSLHKVYRIDIYKPTKDLFKGFIRKWLKLKIISSPKPDNAEEYCRELYSRLNITIGAEEFQPNPALRTLAKLVLNSLWGKFGQRPVKRETMILSSSDRHIAYQNMKVNGEIDEKDVVPLGLSSTMAFFERPGSADNKNVAVAAFVTANARMRLWKELHKLNERVIYHDTDSIIYERDPYDYNVKEGVFLGDWESETGKYFIHEFVSLAPKTYAYTYRKYDALGHHEDVSVVKSKGFTMPDNDETTFSVQTFKQLLLGFLNMHTDTTKARIHSGLAENTCPIAKIGVSSVRFQHLPKALCTVTFNQVKNLICDYSKGFVDPVTTRTYPFGSKALLETTVSDRLIGIDPFENVLPIVCYETPLNLLRRYISF